MNDTELRSHIEAYGRGYDLLKAALNGIPREAWDFKPAENEWSVRELLIHMADSEMMGLIRLGKIISEPGSTLMTYAEDRWSDAMQYRDQDPDEALQLFRSMRRKATHVLMLVGADAAAHSVNHPEYDEPYTIAKWLDIYINHVPSHIGQLQAIHQAWKERG